MISQIDKTTADYFSIKINQITFSNYWVFNFIIILMKTAKILFSTGVLLIMFAYTTKCFAQESGVSPDGKYNWTVIYYPKIINLDLSSPKVKENILQLLKTCLIFYNSERVPCKGIYIYNDSLCLKVNKKRSLTLLSAYTECNLCVRKRQWADSKIQMVNPYWVETVEPNFTYVETGLNKVKDLCDIFFTIQHKFNVKQNELILTDFKSIAERYRNQNPKPAVSEEQRKYIVQANAFTQQKDYMKAIDFYIKAINVRGSQNAYPAAYFNIALLYAQEHFFDWAIQNMKKYLLLVPNAPDARDAQDKIYEWEVNFTK